jgi:hypothetical protein
MGNDSVELVPEYGWGMIEYVQTPEREAGEEVVIGGAEVCASTEGVLLTSMQASAWAPQ